MKTDVVGSRLRACVAALGVGVLTPALLATSFGHANPASAAGQRIYLPSVELARPVRFEAPDRLGGAVTGVAFEGRFAYLPQAERLKVIDLRAQGGPRLVATLVLDEAIAYLALDHPNLWLTMKHDGLLGVDVTDPAKPVVRGRLAPDVAPPGPLAVDGPVGVGVDAGWVAVLDLADIDRPRRVGRTAALAFWGWPYTVALSGGRAHVALYIRAGARSNGDVSRLAVIEIDQPAAPRVAGVLKLGHEIWSLAADGDTAIAVGPWTSVIDVGHTDRPAVIAAIGDGSNTDTIPPAALTLPFDVTSAAIADGVVWLGGRQEVVAIDLRGSSTPRVIGGAADAPADVLRLAGHEVLAASVGDRSPLVLTALTHVARQRVDTTARFATIGYARDIVASDGLALVSGERGDDPSAILDSDTWSGGPIAGILPPEVGRAVFAMDGRTAWASGSGMTGAVDQGAASVHLAEWDVRDPSAPRLAWSTPISGSVRATMLHRGVRYFVGTRWLLGSDKRACVWVARDLVLRSPPPCVELSGDVHAVGGPEAVVGSRDDVFVVSGGAVWRLNARDPEHPVERQIVHLPFSSDAPPPVIAAAIVAGHLMVVDWYRAWAIDLRTGGDVASPMAMLVIMGPSDRPSPPEEPEQRPDLVGARAVFGDPRLYVVDDGILRVFDLRRPLRPVLVTEAVGAHRYAGIALDGDTLLATSSDGGVVRWDVR